MNKKTVAFATGLSLLALGVQSHASTLSLAKLYKVEPDTTGISSSQAKAQKRRQIFERWRSDIEQSNIEIPILSDNQLMSLNSTIAGPAVPKSSDGEQPSTEDLRKLREQYESWLESAGLASASSKALTDSQLTDLKESVDAAESEVSDNETPVADSLALQPKLGMGENKLKPSLTISTTKNFTWGESVTGLSSFNFTANTALKLDNPDEIVNEVVLDGGDIDISFETLIKRSNTDSVKHNWSAGIGLHYSLLTTDEISADSESIEVDSEITSANLLIAYDFNDIIIEYSYRYYDVKNNGEDTMFNDLLDGENASVLTLSIPFSENGHGYRLKFERADIHSLDDSSFKISIETDIENIF